MVATFRIGGFRNFPISQLRQLTSLLANLDELDRSDAAPLRANLTELVTQLDAARGTLPTLTAAIPDLLAVLQHAQQV